MISRCEHCQKPFVASTPGIQACPHCGQPAAVEAPPGFASAQASSPVTVPPVIPAHPEPRMAQPIAAPGQNLPAPSFFDLLWAALMSPSQLMARVDDLPTRVAVRFGYLCTLAGMMGNFTFDALVERARPDTSGMTTMARCVTNHLSDFYDILQPYLIARIPLAPVLAWVTVYGVVFFFRVLGAVMTGPMERARVGQVLGPCLAPLAVAAIPGVSLFACCAWAMWLCGRGLQKLYGLSTGVAMGAASLPLWCWLGLEILVGMRLALPCLPSGAGG